MVNYTVSAIVPIVAVNQLPINFVVVGERGTLKLLATPARNSQSATARLFLLFLYCIDAMVMLFERANPKHDWHGSFRCFSREYASKKFFGGKPPCRISVTPTYSLNDLAARQLLLLPYIVDSVLN